MSALVASRSRVVTLCPRQRRIPKRSPHFIGGPLSAPLPRGPYPGASGARGRLREYDFNVDAIAPVPAAPEQPTNIPTETPGQQSELDRLGSPSRPRSGPDARNPRMETPTPNSKRPEVQPSEPHDRDPRLTPDAERRTPDTGRRTPDAGGPVPDARRLVCGAWCVGLACGA